MMPKIDAAANFMVSRMKSATRSPGITQAAQNIGRAQRQAAYLSVGKLTLALVQCNSLAGMPGATKRSSIQRQRFPLTVITSINDDGSTRNHNSPARVLLRAPLFNHTAGVVRGWM